MSIQTVERFELPKMPGLIGTAPNIMGANTLDISGLSGNISYIWQMPYTGLIDALFFRVNSAQGNGPMVMRADIETVNIPLGLPTGFLINPSASALITINPNASPVNYEVRFPQPFEITQGQHFAINISLSSGTPSGAGNGIRFSVFDDDNSGNLFPYVVDDSAPPAAAAIRNLISPCIGIGLSAVSAIPLPFCWPVDAAPAISFAAPQMHGNKITINSPVRACGATIWGQIASVSSSIILYDTNGVSVLTRQAWHPNLPNVTTISKFNVLFDRPVDLSAGTYYLAVSGGGGTTVGMYYANFPSSFWRKASPMGGTNVVYVSSNTSSGNPNWGEVTTRQTFLGLLVDGIDDGISVGGGETSSVFFA